MTFLSLEGAFFSSSASFAASSAVFPPFLMYSKADVSTCKYFIENNNDNDGLSPEQKEFFRQREEERLKQMVFYCTTSDCLRGYMLKYFGDEHKESCGKCSNCLTEFEVVDVTVETQKILSCIIRTGQNYGVKMISDVLRGVSSDKIRRARLDRQSTFGIMNDVKAMEIKYIIEKLEEQGYIISVGAGKPVLRVTEMSYPVLRGNASVKVRKARQLKSKAQKAEVHAVDTELFDALKVVRMYFAKKKGVPAFVIFSDATLAEMCRVMPTTEAEFLSVSGVGANKLEKYGDAFLRVIRKYVNDKYEVVEVENNNTTESQKSYSVEKIRASGLSWAYAPWTSEEVKKLKEEFTKGISIEELSKIHGRTKGAIRTRLQKEHMI